MGTYVLCCAPIGRIQDVPVVLTAVNTAATIRCDKRPSSEKGGPRCNRDGPCRPVVAPRERRALGLPPLWLPGAWWLPDRAQRDPAEPKFTRSADRPGESEMSASGRAHEMTEVGLTLLLDAERLSDSQIKDLYMTVPDSTTSERNGRTFVAVDREAVDFPSAVVSVIEDVERALPSVKVLGVEPEELVAQSDIAQRRGRSRESISLLVKGERGPRNFPKPRYEVGDRGFWRWADVERWFDAYEGRAPQMRHDAFIEAVNAVLAVRHSQLGLESGERDELQRFARGLNLAAASDRTGAKR